MEEINQKLQLLNLQERFEVGTYHLVQQQWPSKGGFVAIETFSNQTHFNFGRINALSRPCTKNLRYNTDHLH